MMHWVYSFMWDICRALAWALQMAGLLGLIALFLLGVWTLATRTGIND
jgi:hypothetical protein